MLLISYVMTFAIHPFPLKYQTKSIDIIKIKIQKILNTKFSNLITKISKYFIHFRFLKIHFIDVFYCLLGIVLQLFRCSFLENVFLQGNFFSTLEHSVILQPNILYTPQTSAKPYLICFLYIASYILCFFLSIDVQQYNDLKI